MPIPVSEIGPLLITVPELGEVSADEETAQQACVLASGAILDYVGRPLLADTYTATLPVTVDFVDRPSAPNGLVGVAYLPVSPTSITSVTVDGVALTADKWVWDEAFGRVLFEHPSGSYEVVIVYVAGFEEVPPSLRLVARRVARDMLSNPNGITSERLADYQVTYSDADFSALETRILDRFRPSVGTLRAI